jgi:RimJ/RimL family protein N-acetyltransferase
VNTDLELLALEIEALWVKDERGRLVRTREVEGSEAPHMVVAASDQGQIVEFGREVPDGLIGELAAVVAGESSWGGGTMPRAIARCVELLAGVVGPVGVSSGPSFVIPPGVGFSSSVEIVRSAEESSEAALRKRNPARAGWRADEWELLMDGGLGPWAMAVSGGQVVSICHCARLADRGAEAGVWTDPDFRGRGYAAAVTAAWASLLEGSGRTLFYSTSAENVSSRLVAARLGLRGIGWMWRLEIKAPMGNRATNIDALDAQLK